MAKKKACSCLESKKHIFPDLKDLPEDCATFLRKAHNTPYLTEEKYSVSKAAISIGYTIDVALMEQDGRRSARSIAAAKEETDGVKIIRYWIDKVQKAQNRKKAPSPEIDSAEAEQATPKARDKRGAGKE